jgi:hypothetical protein
VSNNNVFTRNFFGYTSLTGMDEVVYRPGSIKVYPVPATQTLFVNTDFGASGLEIFDVSGKSVLKSTGLDVDISGLDEGYYFIRVYDAKQRYASGKFVKVR